MNSINTGTMGCLQVGNRGAFVGEQRQKQEQQRQLGSAEPHQQWQGQATQTRPHLHSLMLSTELTTIRLQTQHNIEAGSNPKQHNRTSALT
jgi:hypothetical protein